MEYLLRDSITESFARPGVQPIGELVAIQLCHMSQRSSFREVLSDQAVEVFVRTAFP